VLFKVLKLYSTPTPNLFEIRFTRNIGSHKTRMCSKLTDTTIQFWQTFFILYHPFLECKTFLKIGQKLFKVDIYKKLACEFLGQLFKIEGNLE